VGGCTRVWRGYSARARVEGLQREHAADAADSGQRTADSRRQTTDCSAGSEEALDGHRERRRATPKGTGCHAQRKATPEPSAVAASLMDGVRATLQTLPGAV
jgi:hypothetical protein